MPHKRKATDTADTSPSKRVALSSANVAERDTPSRRTRSGNQPTLVTTATPKVRRTYGKGAEIGSDVYQNVVKATPEPTTEESDTKPAAGLDITLPTKTRVRKKRASTQASPSMRHHGTARAAEVPSSRHTEAQMPRPIKRMYTRKVVVEVPAPSRPRPEQFPLPQPSLPPRHCETPVTPGKLRTNLLSSSRTQSLLTCKQLPPQFHACLNAQKKTILQTLRTPLRLLYDDQESTNKTPKSILEDLLDATVTRSEGNSCLILGPRGSGKSTILDQCLSSLPEAPIIIRLSGWIHNTDRLAMREIAYQLGQQTGKSFLQVGEDEDDTIVLQDEDDNPFLDYRHSEAIRTGLTLPPSSQLPALISVIPTLTQPTVVILDAFDLFALHPRQALLYCLLDTVQGCRTIADNKGLAVIGLTTRIDTINLLEKRVKSRFSGRVICTSSEPVTQHILSLAKDALSTPVAEVDNNDECLDEWNMVWSKRINQCFDNKELLDSIRDTIGIAKDPNLLFRTLVCAMAQLSPDTPFFTPSMFSRAIASQRSRPPLYDSLDLPYPAICLLIASLHSVTSGHDIFTFEMLFSTFRNQVKASVAAPVQVSGGGIGMVRCSKAVLLGAFEHLVSSRIFVAAAVPSCTMAKEFARFRTTLDREDVKKVTERTGQVMLKKWLNKAE